MRRLSPLLIALALAVLLGAALLLYPRLAALTQRDALVQTSDGSQAPDSSQASDGSSQEQAPQAAPDFTVTDQEGNQVSLSDFQGQPVVLNFWASWCGPCQQEMPHFEEAYQEYGQEIHFLMVNLTGSRDETVETAQAFIQENAYSFPIYFDASYSASIAYGVSGVPVTYFIDAQGGLVAWANGMLDQDTLERGIGMIAPA